MLVVIVRHTQSGQISKAISDVTSSTSDRAGCGRDGCRHGSLRPLERPDSRSTSACPWPPKENRPTLEWAAPSTSPWWRDPTIFFYNFRDQLISRSAARCRREGHWCAPISPHPPRPRGPATASRLAADLTPCAVVRAPQVPGSTGSSSPARLGRCPAAGRVLRIGSCR